MDIKTVVQGLCDEVGCEEAREIIESSIEILEDKDVIEKFGVLKELEDEPDALSEFVKELNDWLDEKLQDKIDEIMEDNEGMSYEEAESEAWKQLEREGHEGYYTEDSVTFEEYLDGPKPYWEVKGEEISGGALGSYNVSEEVKDFAETYHKELTENGDEFLEELEKLESLENEDELEDEEESELER